MYLLFFGTESRGDVFPRNTAISTYAVLMALSCPGMLSSPLRFCRHTEKTTFNFKCTWLNSADNWRALEPGTGHLGAGVLRNQAGKPLVLAVLALGQSGSREAEESVWVQGVGKSGREQVTFCRSLGKAAGAHQVASGATEVMVLLPRLREVD